MTIDVSNDMVELASSLRRGGEETTEYTLNTSPPEAVKGVYFKRYLPMSDQVRNGRNFGRGCGLSNDELNSYVYASYRFRMMS